MRRILRTCCSVTTLLCKHHRVYTNLDVCDVIGWYNLVGPPSYLQLLTEMLSHAIWSTNSNLMSRVYGVSRLHQFLCPWFNLAFCLSWPQHSKLYDICGICHAAKVSGGEPGAHVLQRTVCVIESSERFPITGLDVRWPSHLGLCKYTLWCSHSDKTTCWHTYPCH